MANLVDKLGWKVVTILVSIPVGIGVRKGVEHLWRSARPNDPPRSPSDPDASWGDAIGWAALSAAGVAAAQLVTTKGASSVWRKVMGTPPPVKPTDAADEPALSKAERKALTKA
jgi:Protein of unknown function (DUF4235)